jgi:hypothetical protein
LRIAFGLMLATRRDVLCAGLPRFS